MSIVARYSDAAHSSISVALSAGDVLGGYTGPAQFSVGMAAGNREFDELAALVASGAVTIAAWSPPGVSLVEYARQARDAKEVGGITVQGVPIATDDRSKILIAGARDRALDDPNSVEAWSATDGKTYSLPAAAILAMSRAVGTHVSECFAVFADVKAHLESSPPTITTTAEIDAEFAAMPTAY